jgi:nitroimidazol reductase NimA-like FMN-containing flavoprotein (pyridoxamine 5'-phosphate oxidase superfamily)
MKRNKEGGNMRRKDKEITNIDDKLKIIEKCKFCRIGLCENNRPYVVPLNYGYLYENGKLTLFFHGAAEGEKVDIIKSNNNACFEIDCDAKLIEGDAACDYGYAFKSVIGFGEITILETSEEKTAALNYLMRHQTGKDTEYSFEESQLKNVLIFKMDVQEFTGKEKKL